MPGNDWNVFLFRHVQKGDPHRQIIDNLSPKEIKKNFHHSEGAATLALSMRATSVATDRGRYRTLVYCVTHPRPSRKSLRQGRKPCWQFSHRLYSFQFSLSVYCNDIANPSKIYET